MPQEINQLSRNDRDMLIMLNTKVDQLGFDVKDIKDNVMVRVSKLEQRVDAVDIYHAKIDLVRFERLANWVETVKSNYKLLIFLYGMFCGLLGGFITRLALNWLHF